MSDIPAAKKKVPRFITKPSLPAAAKGSTKSENQGKRKKWAPVKITTRLAVSKRLAKIQKMRRQRPTYEQLLRQTHADSIWGKKAHELSDQDLLLLFEWYSEVNPALYCLLGSSEAIREEKMLKLLLAVSEKQDRTDPAQKLNPHIALTHPCSVQELRPGQVLFKVSQPIHHCFIALRGTFSISVHMAGTGSEQSLCSKENKIMTVKEGQVFGYEDILSCNPTEACRSVQACADGFKKSEGGETTLHNCEVLKFKVDDFLRVLGPVLRKRQRVKMLNEFYLHSRLFNHLRVRDTLSCAAYSKVADYCDGQYIFRESHQSDPNIHNELLFILNGTVVLSMSSSTGMLPLKHLVEGSVIVGSALKQNHGMSQPFTVMANTLNVAVIRMALPLYIYLLLNGHNDQTMIQTASAAFSTIAQRQKRFFRESVNSRHVGSTTTLGDPEGIFQTVFKKSYFLEGLFARDLEEKKLAYKAMGILKEESPADSARPAEAAESPDRNNNRRRLMAARRAKSKEEYDLKRQQDKLTNHLKQQKTWVDSCMDSNWVDAEVLATRKGDGRKSLARHGKALLKLEEALFAVPTRQQLSPTSRLRARRQQKRSKLDHFKQTQRDRQDRFDRARGNRVRRLMTLAQKLEHEFDERMSKIGSTEELDDVMVRRAHNEALIEFEYQRREEAEADSRRQDILMEQELYRAYRRNCLKTVIDRQELKSRQDHLHAMRQMLQTRQQSEPPTLITGTRKNLFKQIGFERRQLPNLYSQRKSSSITPYYTPKNPFRRQTQELDRVLKSLHEEHDNNDKFVEPTKTAAVEDALDAVVAEVQNNSHKILPNSSSDALSPASPNSNHAASAFF